MNVRVFAVLLALMATGQIELIGTQIGSTGSNGGSGNTIAKAVDGDFATFYDAANATGDWLGVDAGAAVTVRTVQFSPRRGSSASSVAADFENKMLGGKIQVSSAADFLSDVTDVLTIPAAPPSYISKVWNTLAISTPTSKRYCRYLGPTGARCTIAELRFIADAGVSAAKPVKPVISPTGGRFISGATTVTLSSGTTSAAIYYTTDGSTPTSGSTLYTVPFSLSIGIGSTKTLKVIAIDGTLATTDSDVVSAVFNGYGYKPEATNDNLGTPLPGNFSVLCGRGGTPLLVGGLYYGYGINNQHYNNTSTTGTIDGTGADGVWCLKSADLYNWTPVGNILNVAGGFTYVITPHAIFCPSTSKYVLWAVGYTIPSSGSNRAQVATADSPDGPWTWISTNLSPDGIGCLSLSLFRDDNDTAYVIYRRDTNGKIVVSQLASDYLTANISHIEMTPDIAEAGMVTKDHEGIYIMVMSAPGNYYDSLSSYGLVAQLSTSMLGTWTAQRNMYIANPLTFPVGGAFNAQPTGLLTFTNGIASLNDFWVQADISQSYPVWLPVDNLVETPTSWDCTQFTAPTNSLLTGLAAYFPLSELTSAAAAVERVAGLNASTNGGTTAAGGVRLRSRSGRFTRANNAAFQTGDIDVWWSIWLKWDGGGFPVAFQKWDAGTECEYQVYYDTTANRLKFLVSPDGTVGAATTLTSTSAGALTSAVWKHLIVYHSASLNELGMFINGTADATTAHTTGIRASTTALTIGSSPTPGNTWGGELMMLGMWKAAKPSTANVSALYNNGHGLPYEYFTAFAGNFGTVFSGPVK